MNCFLASTCEWELTIFVFLWPISHNIMSPSSLHLWQMIGFDSFSWLNGIPLCMDATFSLSSIHWWTSRLFPYLSYWEWCSNKHRCASIFDMLISFPYDIYPVLDCWIIWQIFLIFEETSNCSPWWLYYFIFPQQCARLPFLHILTSIYFSFIIAL
jgi:hypothetical protein